MTDFTEIKNTTINESNIQDDDKQNLEFSYDGDSLSFKVNNDESHTLVTQDDLTEVMDNTTEPTQGPPGIPGIDGSSVIECKLDRDGNLIVKLPVYDEDTSAILSIGGVLTKQQWIDMQNNIIRLNNAVAALTGSGGGSIGTVDLATKTTPGIVQIGDGINVTTKGVISIDGDEIVHDVTNDTESTNTMLDEVFNS